MKQHLELISIYLDKSYQRSDIENKLDITLRKRIESTYFALTGENSLVVYSMFNVLTFINWSRDDIHLALYELGVVKHERFDEENIFQDYPIEIDSASAKDFSVDNNKIILKKFDTTMLLIIAYVISQSVAMEHYEGVLSDYHEHSRSLIEAADSRSIFKRHKIIKFVKRLALLRHDILLDLHLLDKPNILWDNEMMEAMYNELAGILELGDRFEVVTFKLNNIKDDVTMVMDFIDHNHSSFLEWIIILLIGVEIVMGLLELSGVLH